MSVLARSALWRRLDTDGTEHVLYDDRSGLRARGTVLSTDPVPHTCRYQLLTDERWCTRLFEVETEGAGWQRQVRLERSSDGWRVTTHERGNLSPLLARAGRSGPAQPGTERPDELAGALDVDLLNSPLTNTLPLRRLGLVPGGRADGTGYDIVAAWVLLPELTVLPSRQTYSLLAPGRVSYESGSFATELTVDPGGFVTHYPGFADRLA